MRIPSRPLPLKSPPAFPRPPSKWPLPFRPRQRGSGCASRPLPARSPAGGRARPSSAFPSSSEYPGDKDKDIGFYEGCESGSYLLKTGDFMVCFPSDAHKVGMMNTVPGMVKKVVVKIRVEE